MFVVRVNLKIPFQSSSAAAAKVAESEHVNGANSVWRTTRSTTTTLNEEPKYAESAATKRRGHFARFEAQISDLERHFVSAAVAEEPQTRFSRSNVFNVVYETVIDKVQKCPGNSR